MLNIRSFAAVVGLVLGAMGEVGTVQAGSYGPYQYSASRGYGYRTYSYYSSTHRSYRHHVAVYRPSQPRYVYYYNSHSGKYWGRYDCITGKYQLLPENKKTADLDVLKETDFLAPGPMPGEGEGSDESLLPPPLPEALKGGNQAPTPMPKPQTQPIVIVLPGSTGTYGGCRK